jgi:methylglyoxal synthase
MAVSKVEMAVPAKKTIALVAHDNMKDEMLEWAQAHRSELAQHTLVGTGTTGRIIAEHPGLEVERLKSGPLGGDQQLGGRIAEGRIDIMMFFWDPLEPQPHDPDIKALLRIAARLPSCDHDGGNTRSASSPPPPSPPGLLLLPRQHVPRSPTSPQRPERRSRA